MRKSGRFVWKDYLIILAVIAVIIILLIVMACGVFYPQNYKSTVFKYAEENSVDPILIMSIIHAESGFKPNAVSTKGAVGLMQILPSTAEWIANKEKVSREFDLLSPQDNINIATMYVKYLFGKYNNMDMVIVAYNAGEGNLDKWRSVCGEGDLRIPYEETRNYLKKVNKNYKIYSLIM